MSTWHYDHGLVIGKFLPPHRGHHFLIETALAACRHLDVIVCRRSDDPIPAAERAAWLAELHPRAEVRVIDDHYDGEDSALWARLTVEWLGRAPEVVFTSEAYGEAYAAHLGCRHVSVDPDRRAFPCSGTAVRLDPLAMWEYLAPPVRAWYARRIVVLGAESTGTTTLAEDLAVVLNTVWVPEYGRTYSAEHWEDGQHDWQSPEFLVIAQEQARQEDLLARECNGILVCDTDPFATRLWHRRYVGGDFPELDRFVAQRRPPALYVLTGDEIPFVQDGLRDGEHLRHEMHGGFEEALRQQITPWLLVRGSREERVAAVVHRLAALGVDRVT